MENEQNIVPSRPTEWPSLNNIHKIPNADNPPPNISKIVTTNRPTCKLLANGVFSNCLDIQSSSEFQFKFR